MMFVALLLHLAAIPALGMYLLFAVPAEGLRHVWKRLPLFIALWLTLSLLSVIHVIGHLLDELLFFRYRRVVIREPVFILGIPRSGTTYLQRLLGVDDRFTTLATWEALLAPSISERYLYRMLGRLLRPVENAVIAVRRKLFRTMDDIHQIRLQEPEEDFLLLLPLMACLLVAFACPRASHFWRLAWFDMKLPAWYRRTVLTFYARCLQKHLFYHGEDLRILSKNPSFTSLVQSLLDNFPGARIIACTRPPAEVLPSQLSSLRPAMSILGSGKLSPQTQNTMIGLLHHYYSQLLKYSQDKRIHFLPMAILQSDLPYAMTSLFAFLAMPQSAASLEAVARARESGKHTSSHRYTLAEFALTEAIIEDRFQHVWRALYAATSKENTPT